MRIVALLAVRNSEPYMHRCLSHLIAQGVEIFVIDNQSTDRTAKISREYFGRGVIDVVEYAYPGYYDWAGLLKKKEDVAKALGADWYIHHDSDEIRQPPPQWATLREGIESVDAAGYNAVNFDEFIFIPKERGEDYSQDDYVDNMRHYFYFRPRGNFRVNAWKNDRQIIDLVSSGGHEVKFSDRRVYPENFLLRHYICLSYAHAEYKYFKDHIYSKDEVEKRGWHVNRVKALETGLQLPYISKLKFLSPDDAFDRSDPQTRNLVFERG